MCTVDVILQACNMVAGRKPAVCDLEDNMKDIVGKSVPGTNNTIEGSKHTYHIVEPHHKQCIYMCEVKHTTNKALK